jgi:O-antigen ligase
MTALAIPRFSIGNWLDRFEFQLPWFALTPLLLIPVIGQSSSNLNMLLFLTELLLLVAGTRRPIWIVGALLMSEMCAANYIHEFGMGISNRLLLTAMSVPLVLPHIAHRVDMGRRARLTIFLALTFVAITSAVNLSRSEDAYVLEFLRYISLGVYLLVLIPMSVRDRDDIRDLCTLLFGIAALSAFVGLSQHFHDGRGTPMWQTVPHPGAVGENFESWESRLLGLSENPIQSGNVYMIAGLFALGVLLYAPMQSSTKRWMAFALLMMCAAAYYTYTRSWAIAMMPALGTIALLYRGKYKREFLLLIVVLGGGLYYWSDMKSSRYTETAQNDSSAAARPVLWTLGLHIAYDHPWFGVGHDSFLDLSKEYTNEVPDDLLQMQGAKDVIGKYTVHNDPINVWLSWGFFALFVYLALTIVIGKNFYDTWAIVEDPLLKGLALGGLAAVIGFQVNSLFHNFLDSTLTFWILGGFSLVLLKLAQTEYVPRPPKPRPTPTPQVVLARNEMGEWEECSV